MKKILFFHQSADMYGSDKVLLSLVGGLDQSRFRPIVLLPCIGPLSEALERAQVEYHVVPLVRAERSMFSLSGILRVPVDAWRSVRAINRIISADTIHLVHSNTLAVLSGMMWARLHGVPHVWHVHEMIEHPRLVRKLYGWLLRLFSDKIICNSIATQNVILLDQPCIEKKISVVWNGMDRAEMPQSHEVAAFRERLGLSSSDVLVTLMGRINRWKGQSLLVDAAEIVDKNMPDRAHYLIVGSPPQGQEHFLSSLLARIKTSSAYSRITVMPYTSEIWTVWDATDIAVVPSTEPEPFGMVALEAMAAKKPVIAANHGGVTEIVIHSQTGILFQPNNANELAKAVQDLIENPEMRMAMGIGSFLRYQECFSLNAYVAGIAKVYDDLS